MWVYLFSTAQFSRVLNQTKWKSTASNADYFIKNQTECTLFQPSSFYFAAKYTLAGLGRVLVRISTDLKPSYLWVRETKLQGLSIPVGILQQLLFTCMNLLDYYQGTGIGTVRTIQKGLKSSLASCSSGLWVRYQWARSLLCATRGEWSMNRPYTWLAEL